MDIHTHTLESSGQAPHSFTVCLSVSFLGARARMGFVLIRHGQFLTLCLACVDVNVVCEQACSASAVSNYSCSLSPPPLLTAHVKLSGNGNLARERARAKSLFANVCFNAFTKFRSKNTIIIVRVTIGLDAHNTKELAQSLHGYCFEFLNF